MNSCGLDAASPDSLSASPLFSNFERAPAVGMSFTHSLVEQLNISILDIVSEQVQPRPVLSSLVHPFVPPGRK